MELGRFGVWYSFSWATPTLSVEEVAGEMEAAGYSTLWASGAFEPGIAGLFAKLLGGTERATVATGILSIWVNEPGAVAAQVEALGERFLLGIGASHSVVVESTGEAYERPYSKVAAFLDGLDAAPGGGVPAERRALAALGPRMLRLAADRAYAAHPYFVPVEHTARARETLGAGPVLAPEMAVVLETEPSRARELARSHTTMYLTLPNYVNNLRTLGWEEADFADGGSDRLVDAIVAWGTPQSVAERVRAHHDAGADHVCLQMITGQHQEFPLRHYQELAAALS